MKPEQNELRSGLWHYSPERMALIFDGSSLPQYNPTYVIELDRLTTSGHLLDFILQIHGKGCWSEAHQKSMGMHKDYQVSEFITLAGMLCREFLGTNIQGAFSPSGEHRAIDWDKLISEKLK
jgi:hypothetical protein